MTIPTTDAVRDTWSRRARETPLGERAAVFLAVLERLADGIPASPDDLAAATGLPVDEIRRLVAASASIGYEVRDGAIIGAALTLNPTAHRFRVRGNDLHTWCGFDALFIPLLIDERAEVRSTCPVTGADIHLRVEADGSVHDVTPAETVIAVVGSEVTSCCPTTGPGSAICTQMPFLSSRRAGEVWLRGRDGVAVLDLESAMEVAAGYARAVRGHGAPSSGGGSRRCSAP